jgi:hypothetical protein
MVVFFSDRVLHRVRPSRAQRLCFSVWIDSSRVNSPDDVHLKAKHITLSAGNTAHDAAQFFDNSPLQRVVSRALYCDEYEDSLRDLGSSSTAPADTRASIMQIKEHRARVSALVKNVALASFFDEMRKLKTDLPREVRMVISSDANAFDGPSLATTRIQNLNSSDEGEAERREG